MVEAFGRAINRGVLAAARDPDTAIQALVNHAPDRPRLRILETTEEDMGGWLRLADGMFTTAFLPSLHDRRIVAARHVVAGHGSGQRPQTWDGSVMRYDRSLNRHVTLLTGQAPVSQGQASIVSTLARPSRYRIRLPHRRG